MRVSAVGGTRLTPGRVGLLVLFLVGACGRISFDERNDGGLDGTVAIGGTCSADLECTLCARCENQVCVAEPVIDVALGHRHLCYLGANGSRWCAGENVSNALALGIPDPIVWRPRRIAGDDGYTRLFLGWGGGNGIRNGRLWDLPSGSTGLPGEAAVSDVSNLDDISLDAFGACSVFVDGTLSCDATSSTWQAFDQGTEAQCGIKPGGTLWCWGVNHTNILGQGLMPDDTKLVDPTQVGTDTDWREVSAGNGIACALKTDDALHCWGAGSATGTNGIDTGGVPTRIGVDTDWATITTHWTRTCARKQDGRIYCWGDDVDAPIVPGATSVPVPTELTGGPYDRVVVGGHAECVRRLDGSWACIGSNELGMLGIGSQAQPSGFADLCPAP